MILFLELGLSSSRGDDQKYLVWQIQNIECLVFL